MYSRPKLVFLGNLKNETKVGFHEFVDGFFISSLDTFSHLFLREKWSHSDITQVSG